MRLNDITGEVNEDEKKRGLRTESGDMRKHWQRRLKRNSEIEGKLRW